VSAAPDAQLPYAARPHCISCHTSLRKELAGVLRCSGSSLLQPVCLHAALCGIAC
jgi:hypothetical protein